MSKRNRPNSLADKVVTFYEDDSRVSSTLRGNPRLSGETEKSIRPLEES